MTTVLLIRHAETDAVGRFISGWMKGVHLNESGREQAALLARRLARAPLRAIYCSPLERAIETAEPVAAATGAAIQVRDAIGEIRFGEWTGRTFEELEVIPEWRKFNTSRSTTRIPGGELMLETQARMVAELECIRSRHPAEIAAVVSHGDPIRAAVLYFAGMPLDFYDRIEISPASVTVLALDAASRIVRLNDTGEMKFSEKGLV